MEHQIISIIQRILEETFEKTIYSNLVLSIGEVYINSKCKQREKTVWISLEIQVQAHQDLGEVTQWVRPKHKLLKKTEGLNHTKIDLILTMLKWVQQIIGLTTDKKLGQPQWISWTE